ncbi:hypothetical protein OROGR_013934 [Orobanche gracilis]
MRNEVLSNDDAIGYPIASHQLRGMQEVCYQLLKLGTGECCQIREVIMQMGGGRGRVKFSGSHPVSQNRYSHGGTPERNHHYTLLDGETEAREKIPDLRFDCNQSSLFDRGWKLLEKEVIEPRNMERESLSKSLDPYYRYDLEPVSVCMIIYILFSETFFIPQLSHSSDGLVFQGWDDPYVPRTHEGLLKWKYPEMNSVDFQFEVV